MLEQSGRRPQCPPAPARVSSQVGNDAEEEGRACRVRREEGAAQATAGPAPSSGQEAAHRDQSILLGGGMPNQPSLVFGGGEITRVDPFRSRGGRPDWGVGRGQGDLPWPSFRTGNAAGEGRFWLYPSPRGTSDCGGAFGGIQGDSGAWSPNTLQTKVVGNDGSQGGAGFPWGGVPVFYWGPRVTRLVEAHFLVFPA